MGAVVRGEDDEMPEAGLSKGAVDFEPDGVGGQVAAMNYEIRTLVLLVVR